MDGWMDGWVGGWVDGRLEVCMYVWMDGKMYTHQHHDHHHHQHNINIMTIVIITTTIIKIINVAHVTVIAAIALDIICVATHSDCSRYCQCVRVVRMWVMFLSFSGEHIDCHCCHSYQ